MNVKLSDRTKFLIEALTMNKEELLDKYITLKGTNELNISNTEKIINRESVKDKRITHLESVILDVKKILNHIYETSDDIDSSKDAKKLLDQLSHQLTDTN